MTLRLLGLSGSLRKDSSTAAILRTLQAELAGRAEVVIGDIAAVPLFNQDLEASAPAGVQALRDLAVTCQGVLIVSPEYNHGITGVLKNTLDWLSRNPFVLKGLPCVVMSSSPGGIGGARSLPMVRETLTAMGAVLVAAPEVNVAGVYNKITDGKLTDEASLKFALAAAEALIIATDKS